jgi:FtsP/CotA-like multicopper oxidase with cupredoxin domain
MMRRSKHWFFLGAVVVVILLAAGCVNLHAQHSAEMPGHVKNAVGGQLSKPTIYKDLQGRVVKEFTVVAQEAEWQVSPDYSVRALTYDGTVPGKTIQVEQGDHVKVRLINKMKVPVTIHWHGYPVPNKMDGVPGLTQDEVAPGKTYTYDFVATIPGTYWYHSHFQSSDQVGKGLYGAFIVLPKEKRTQYDRDYVLMLGEWMNHQGNMGQSGGHMEHGGMNMGGSGMNMDHSMMMGGGQDSSMPQMDHDEMMKQMYNLYSVNGNSGSLVQPLTVKKGERVRLRLINTGYMTHKIHLQGQPFQVVATDGHEISDPPVVKDKLVAIGAGERVDVSFVAGSKDFAIDFHDGTPGAKTLVIPVRVIGGEKTPAKADQLSLPELDMSKYATNSRTENVEPSASSYVLRLNESMQNGEEVYTINGKTWPNTDPIEVKKGERVKITFINEGHSDHPMHLHGHVFKVISRNGVRMSVPLEKDTLVVRPGEKYEIEFTADNPGNWMLHCHELHHAAAGMMMIVKYQDYKSDYSVKMNTVHE